MATCAINYFLGLFIIQQFKIPDFDKDTINRIATNTKNYVTASRQDRQYATRLLDAAKRAVEIAIEDSEAAALAYLVAANPLADKAKGGIGQEFARSGY